jgi:N-acetylglucosamine kinase-like BadF-type ATPase
VALFLGIDAGGSKCDAVLLDDTGTVLGWGTGGATRYYPPEVIAASLTDAVSMACGDREVQDLHLGGVGVARIVLDWLSERDISFTLTGLGEGRGCFRAALLDYGLVVLAGTGSFAYACTSDGRQSLIDGLGPLLGDQGSGYDIGLRGLRSVLRLGPTANDRSPLRAALFQATGVTHESELLNMIRSGRLGRAEMAALCPVVVERAEAGDALALKAVRQAAAELTQSAAVVWKELGLQGAGYTVVGMGGVIQGSPLYWRFLSEMLGELDPTFAFTVPPVKLVIGAAFEAMAQCGIPVTLELRDRVVETQRAFPASRVETNGSDECHAAN